MAAGAQVRFSGAAEDATAAPNEQRAGREPAGLAFGAGSVWVGNTYDGTASRVDAARNKVTATIRVADSPTGIAFLGGKVWVVVR